ncbi:MAG: SelB C-terminal domain-containing protein, partial [Acidimicrobiia bacterium]|nr:SelB C-terminal domain-containing protein [Acidimicrobiia bacterium]
GITRDEIGRGSLLTNLPWPTSSAFSVRLRAARYADAVGERGAYHLHMGSGSWPVELRPLSAAPAGPDDGTSVGGREMAVLLRSDTPLPVRVGERFILRETGRQSVVAGGRIVDPAAPHRATQASLAFKQLEKILEVDCDEAATMLLDVRGVASVAALAGWTAGGQPGSGLRSGDLVISNARAQELVDAAVTTVTAFHEEHPLREGMPIASLASGLGLDIDVTRLVLATDQRIRDDGSSVAIASFNAGLTDRQEADLAGAIKLLDDAGFNVPKLTELGLDRELLHIALREERLVRVSDDFVFLPAQLADIRARVGELSSPFGVGDFKDLIGVSRKYAVPLLEYFDAAGVTRRVGNDRVLR